MSHGVKVAISLPQDLLDAAERERATSGESRSQLFRRALERLLEEAREREADERYGAAYRRLPDDADDIAAADAMAGESLGVEPWDDE